MFRIDKVIHSQRKQMRLLVLNDPPLPLSSSGLRVERKWGGLRWPFVSPMRVRAGRGSCQKCTKWCGILQKKEELQVSVTVAREAMKRAETTMKEVAAHGETLEALRDVKSVLRQMDGKLQGVRAALKEEEALVTLWKKRHKTTADLFAELKEELRNSRERECTQGCDQCHPSSDEETRERTQIPCVE